MSPMRGSWTPLMEPGVILYSKEDGNVKEALNKSPLSALR
jgi:hypothetical protein